MKYALPLAILFALAPVGCGGGNMSANDPSDGGDDSGGGAVQIGKEAPEVIAESIGGDGPTTIADGKGQVVIVDFWATFCDPCRKSFPAYQELVDKYAGDLAVIAISVDDPEDATEEDVKKFAEDLGVTFAIVWDKDQSTAGTYKPPKMPTSYIIDKDGVLQHIHAGYESGEADEIDKEVAELLEQ
jgi:thiol-disulfide isomerase/thioredoxin